MPPKIRPAMAMPRPPEGVPSALEVCLRPMSPKTIESSDGNIYHADGRPMIPRTRDAMQKPLVEPVTSRVVPSMVKGMPQLWQLFAVMGLLA